MLTVTSIVITAFRRGVKSVGKDDGFCFVGLSHEDAMVPERKGN